MNILQELTMLITSFVLAATPMTKYTEGIVGQPRSFLPGQTVTAHDQTVSELIYRGLFAYDIYGTLVPDLADSWEISDDGLVYTIHLKENQQWSDGRTITSNDLIYTAFNLEDLQGVATDKVDDLTVRYTLPNKYSPFLSLLTVGVLPENSLENLDPINMVNSGPFRILNIEKSGPIIQQVNLLHEDADHKIRKLSFRYYSNEEELSTGAKLGEIDGFLSSEKLELPTFNYDSFPLQGVYYSLFFNLDNEKLSDLEFRKKLEEVLPVERMVNEKGIPVQGPISRSAFTDMDLDFKKYNEDFVSEFNDVTLSITVPDIKSHVEMAKEVDKVWETKLGIEVEVIKVDPDKFSKDVIENRNYEVLFYGQEIGRDPDRYVNWHSTQKASPGLNLSNFEHVRADRALEEGRNEIDNEKRVVHYNEFQRAVSENVPAVFLYHPIAHYNISKYIEGVGEKYTFSVADRFLDFDNWNRVRTN